MRKGFSILVLLIVVFAVVAIAGILYLNFQKKLILDPVPVSTQSSSPAAVIKSDWKLYENESLGFSFEYPQDYYLNNAGGSDHVVLYNKDPHGQSYWTTYYLSFLVSKNASFEALANNNSNFKYVSAKQVGQYQGFEVQGLPKPGGVSEYDYFLNHNTDLIHISFGGSLQNENNESFVEFKKTVNQILSSFKFID